MTAAGCDTMNDATLMKQNEIPRIALFISNPELLSEAEQVLRKRYSSLLLISEKEKLKDFTLPLIIVADRIKDVPEIKELRPPEGTRILVILQEGDGEVTGVAFEAGADDFIPHPFSPDVFIEKTERYLQAFRKNP